MYTKSVSQIYKRTLDYLARKHPWFDAIIRNRWIALGLLVLYLVTVFVMTWVIHSGEEGGWKEVVKSYSPIFFDLLIIFLISPAFLLARGYFCEEETRIDLENRPDPDLFFVIKHSSLFLKVEDRDFFKRHAAVAAILDALPINQSDLFLAHAGSLDIPKLTLKSVSVSDSNKLEFTLGVASFKEFFFTHHFADYVLSRSSSSDSEAKETLRKIFSPIYYRAYKDFFAGRSAKLDFLTFTPNTLGVTGCIQIACENDSIFLMQKRGYHESAGRGFVQLGYAGTISAYPDFANSSETLTIEKLANDEFGDEFMNAEPGKLLRQSVNDFKVEHDLVGLCANSQYLFQPELFMLTKITVPNTNSITIFADAFALKQNRRFVAFRSLDVIDSLLSEAGYKLRPLCQVAINQIYKPLFLS